MILFPLVLPDAKKKNDLLKMIKNYFSEEKLYVYNI